ncbi:MAG: SRPBCC family protein [Bacteroidota bacterium]
MYQYKAQQWLPMNMVDAWTFFSSPENLAKITPPSMDFKMTSKAESSIYDGMIIDYKVKPLMGIAVKWRTEIDKVVFQKQFMDRQLKGPYKVWEHTHTFTESDGGVLMNDVINYQLPFGFIGRIAHGLFVKRKLESIFNYRKETLIKLFGDK